MEANKRIFRSNNMTLACCLNNVNNFEVLAAKGEDKITLFEGFVHRHIMDPDSQIDIIFNNNEISLDINIYGEAPHFRHHNAKYKISTKEALDILMHILCNGATYA